MREYLFEESDDDLHVTWKFVLKNVKKDFSPMKEDNEVIKHLIPLWCWTDAEWPSKFTPTMSQFHQHLMPKFCDSVSQPFLIHGILTKFCRYLAAPLDGQIDLKIQELYWLAAPVALAHSTLAHSTLAHSTLALSTLAPSWHRAQGIKDEWNSSCVYKKSWA